MIDYIPLSTLNDFIFCPYSIYLHSVYMEADEDIYKALPQTKGTIAQQGIDMKKISQNLAMLYTEISQLSIFDSANLGLYKCVQFLINN